MIDFISFLEESWLFIFLISIIFVFIIIFRDLGNQTRKQKYWRRSSYQKVLPRVILTFQHFSRRSELLSVTNYGMCQNIRHDLITCLKIKHGYNDDEIEALLTNRKELQEMFADEKVVMFLLDTNIWLNSITPKSSFLSKLFQPIKNLIQEERDQDKEFFIELALVIRNFRKALDA